MIGGRRLVRVRLSNEKASIDKMLAAAQRGGSAVVIGGVGTIAVVGLWAWLFPDLRRRDHLIPDKL